MSLSRNIGTLTIAQEDNAGVALIARTVGPLTYDGAAGEFQTGQLVTTAVTTFTLPVSPIRQLYFRNRSTGSAKVTLQWTPQAGTSAEVGVLGPNAFIAFWATTTESSGGITALKAQTDSTSCPVEFFFGG